ncbi:ATP-dependent zinc metalloprotease FtsH 3 [Rubripirellula obstinata]|uniref:ATP-dependent zinc metalloprotease FtsH 3 n=1 Tax=Rubripirellula obstinata TaxID=406547 RepID=A0A5B1CFU8_9BACT|nr:cell division protein FtsH [Rubripirellula obstinata]KAA1260077.1 ATP-dependent zinc metalloprotease FtsH 3 [Rubripirellula obstinata]
MEQPDQQRTATAYHEAGHAVMAAIVGRPIQKVSIAPGKLQTGGGRLGVCQIQKGRIKSSKDWLEDEVMILFSGMVAEAHFTGKYCPAGAGQDLQGIARLIRTRPGSERQLEKVQRRMLDKTEHLLSDESNAQAIRWIAEELLAKTTISGRAVKHFLQQAEGRSR